MKQGYPNWIKLRNSFRGTNVSICYKQIFHLTFPISNEDFGRFSKIIEKTSKSCGLLCVECRAYTRLCKYHYFLGLKFIANIWIFFVSSSVANILSTFSLFLFLHLTCFLSLLTQSNAVAVHNRIEEPIGNRGEIAAWIGVHQSQLNSFQYLLKSKSRRYRQTYRII